MVFSKSVQAVSRKAQGKVERPFRYIREAFFLARSFRKIADANEQLCCWLGGVANARRHATTRRIVNEGLAEEKPYPIILSRCPWPLSGQCCA